NSALRGADSAEALIEAINLADIDDKYAKYTFTVEKAVEKPVEKPVEKSVEKTGENSGGTTENSTPGVFESIINFISGIFGMS
ncbi:MAG: hypothetical protein PHV39_07115, partial [Methanomicrobium sp.]|nr:hypothetical protein [Methanomicrobium sp.]